MILSSSVKFDNFTRVYKGISNAAHYRNIEARMVLGVDELHMHRKHIVDVKVGELSIPNETDQISDEHMAFDEYQA